MKYCIFILILLITIPAFGQVSEKPQVLASFDFDPRVDGFPFKNYANDGRNWKDDVATDDLIKMFGVQQPCLPGGSAKSCVLKTPAREWVSHMLEAMEIGHCEGIAVASLRMKTGYPFKGLLDPGKFHPGARRPFDITLAQPIENYIAYYWITQTFPEVSKPTAAIAAKGPHEVVRMLIPLLNGNTDTALLGIFKFEKGRKFDGHAVVPFGVEDIGTHYRIKVYDSNFPGQTRYLFVSKATSQQWTYSSSADPKAKPDYVGDRASRTLSLTATSWREGRCFAAEFRDFRDQLTGCNAEPRVVRAPTVTTASFAPPGYQGEQEYAETFLTGEGELLVIDGNGKRLGYDPRTDRNYDEIPDSVRDLMIGGLGLDLPHFTFPYDPEGKDYTFIFSGKYLTEESDLDFVFSAPGFTVGFDGIKLDKGEVLVATISADGEEIRFVASADGETPEVFYSFDADEDDAPSYVTYIEGVELSALKALTYEFDLEKGKLFFSDDDGNEDEYDIYLLRVNADGTEDVYRQNDIEFGKGDDYEMDFGDWKGGDDTICFKEDDEDDGFQDEQCVEEENEEPGD